jgi:hypothetical protein
MQKLVRFVVCIILVGGQGMHLFARQSAPPAAEDKTPPSYDMKAQAVLDLQQMQDKFTKLAEAIPQGKFSWRPSADIRSISELFLHVASSGFFFPTMKGAPPATGFSPKDFEKSTTDKAKIIEWLNKSFAYDIASVQGMCNADFAAPLPKLGPDTNQGDVVYLLVSHAHEQLGIAIAYSRSVGVVPPWTADELKKKAKTP